jgi:galactoside O-acetyltransferase
MSGGWLPLQHLRNLGIKMYGKNIHVSDACKIYNPSNLILHDNIRIDDFTILSAKGVIELFNYVHIASHCQLSSSTRIECHDFTGIASGSKLFGSTDDYGGAYLTSPTVPIRYANVKTGDIILNDHVILGSNTIVLPGVNFGEGTSVGAMSLITKSTDPWGIYTGIPARKLRERKRDCLNMAEQLKVHLK